MNQAATHSAPAQAPQANTPYSTVTPLMQELVNNRLEAFRGDYTQDLRNFEKHTHIKRWLWIPYKYGTHLLPLIPRHKNIATATLESYTSMFQTNPETYLITPDSITPVTLQEAENAIREVPEPDYMVTNQDGFCLARTSRWAEARKAQKNSPGSTLIEMREQATIQNKMYTPAQANKPPHP